MTNTCEDAGNYVNTRNERIRNFGNQGGYVGTPMQFTAQSLNTGYIGMAAELDLCDIKGVATKMGVTLGTGGEIPMTSPAEVIGVDAVSPLAMAGAYATVANGGSYCEPKVIDRVSDNDGVDRPELVPQTTCTPVLTPEVASTAALALQGVMRGGGTGSQANPGDGTPLIGKTGTHEQLQSWMIESSTNVTTAVWAGNSAGFTDISRTYYNGRRLMDLRYPIARATQAVANDVYGGDAFPETFGDLTRRVVKEVPNVVGQPVEQAEATLREAGWDVTVGDPVDSDQPTNIIAAQNPAGSAPSGTTITINPSNGQATTIPSVAGLNLNQATQTLRAAGFTNLTGSCTADPNAPNNDGSVSGTNPGAGTAANRSASIAVSYTARSC
jgi:membrane peptidoglycan carboxypeptidase